MKRRRFSGVGSPSRSERKAISAAVRARARCAAFPIDTTAI